MKFFKCILCLVTIFSLASSAVMAEDKSSNLAAGAACSGLLNESVVDIDGNTVDLCKYQGKVLLVVNVASKCGYTTQYSDLETLYQKYKDRDFVILAFPSNDFKEQEPGSNEQIESFARGNYGVTFPMFSKIHVIGPQSAPFYQKLSDANGRRVEWNFQKFLIGRNGDFVKSFSPKTEPLAPALESAIQKELNKVSVSSR